MNAENSRTGEVVADAEIVGGLEPHSVRFSITDLQLWVDDLVDSVLDQYKDMSEEEANVLVEAGDKVNEVMETQFGVDTMHSGGLNLRAELRMLCNAIDPVMKDLEGKVSEEVFEVIGWLRSGLGEHVLESLVLADDDIQASLKRREAAIRAALEESTTSVNEEVVEAASEEVETNSLSTAEKKFLLLEALSGLVDGDWAESQGLTVAEIQSELADNDCPLPTDEIEALIKSMLVLSVRGPAADSVKPTSLRKVFNSNIGLEMIAWNQKVEGSKEKRYVITPAGLQQIEA